MVAGVQVVLVGCGYVMYDSVYFILALWGVVLYGCGLECWDVGVRVLVLVEGVVEVYSAVITGGVGVSAWRRGEVLSLFGR